MTINLKLYFFAVSFSGPLYYTKCTISEYFAIKLYHTLPLSPSLYIKLGNSPTCFIKKDRFDFTALSHRCMRKTCVYMKEIGSFWVCQHFMKISCTVGIKMEHDTKDLLLSAGQAKFISSQPFFVLSPL